MNSERVRIWIGFIIVSTVWGSTWLAIKIGLESVPPFFAAALRFAIAVSILFVIVRWRRIPIPWTPDAKKLYIILVFLTYAIPFALVYWAEQYISSGLTSILFAAFPFWVAIFSHALLPHERLNAYKIAGIVLGFVGIVVIFSRDLELSSNGGLMGMAAMFIVAIMQALSTVLVKRYGQPVSPMAMNLVGMSGGCALLFVLSFLTESFNAIVWDGAAIGSIVYLAAAGSVLTFVTYYWLLKRIEAVYLSLTSFINPIIAVILGAIILGETLSPSVTVGTTFVLLGILVANGRLFYAKVAQRA